MLDDVLERVRVIVVAGVAVGVLVAGLGSRLAMFLLFRTSPDFVDGITSDDGFEIGRFTFSGTYNQLITYVIVAVFLFHAATGAAVMVLRRTRPDAPRPYRVWAYPLLPVLVVVSALAFVANSLVEKPVESGIGLALLALGIPAYLGWRRKEGA